MGLYTEDDIRAERQVQMCMFSLDEYFREQNISIDQRALYEKLQYPPMLFQFAHLIAFHKMDWKDALRWCMCHRGEIIAYHERKIDEHGAPKLLLVKDDDGEDRSEDSKSV